MKPTRKPEAVAITSAKTGHTEDLDSRVNRYLFSMAIRTVCFILVVVIDSPWRWAFAVAAVFLPYVAVVLANRGSDPRATWTYPEEILPAAPMPPRQAAVAVKELLAQADVQGTPDPSADASATPSASTPNAPTTSASKITESTPSNPVADG